MKVEIGPVTATVAVSWEGDDLRTYEEYVVKLEGPEGEIDELLRDEPRATIDAKVVEQLPALAREI